jgi:hypothetical protein
MSDIIFRRNLLALARNDPSLGDRLAEAAPDPSIRAVESRTGTLVPVARVGDRVQPFHSLIDPEREAARIEEAQPAGGFIIAFGLGSGILLKRYLASSATTGILVVEYSAAKLRAVLEEIDLSDLFADERFTLALDPAPARLKELLLAVYVPPLAGDIRSLPLRARVDLDPEPFAQASRALSGILGSISDDYSVQAFFGKLWFQNAVRNLFAAERQSAPLPRIRKAAVTAAGPSLESALPALAEAKGRGAFVIATDTSLPALVGAGLAPDAVVSIDCQHISYYHFLGGIPEGVPLVLDLASPSMLHRLSGNSRFFSSGHPFCAYLSGRWRPFPALDTSGGNVTHAALSLAEALGAESALLAGADFSYPDGKSYARGTYIYDYFGSRQARLAPVEALFAGFMFRGVETSREDCVDSGGERYSRYLTKPLVAYREHLERFAASSPMEIVPMRGKGVEIRVSRGQGAGPASVARRPRERRIFAAGNAACSAADFLGKYSRDLAGLPAPRDPAIRYLTSLNSEERDLWTTLLPAASAFQRELRGKLPDPASLLETTRDWAIETIEDALSERGSL